MVSRKSSPIGGRNSGKQGPRWKTPQNDGWQGCPLSTLQGARAGGTSTCAHARPITANATKTMSAPIGRMRPRLLHVGRHLHVDDAVGIGRRLATFELVDHIHAAHDLADHRVLTVEERAVVKHDEELAV